jgi:outer membrane protein assembly factor BamC
MLSACSQTNHPQTIAQTNYLERSNRQKSLEVPPDLTKPAHEERLSIPKLSNQDISIQSKGNIRLEQNSKGYYLIAQQAKPLELWEDIRQFWIKQGFKLEKEQPELGIMETNWLENRAQLQSDGLRALAEKFGLGSVFSTGTRDSYRTRMEVRGAQAEIFITHRAIEEKFTNAAKDQTEWNSAPYNKELEIEFLKRLMISLQKQ